MSHNLIIYYVILYVSTFWYNFNIEIIDNKIIVRFSEQVFKNMTDI